MTKPISPNKDLNALIKKAVKQGWRIETTTSNHLRWISPSGARVMSAKTPSDFRAIKNILKELKHRGFVA